MKNHCDAEGIEGPEASGERRVPPELISNENEGIEAPEALGVRQTPKAYFSRTYVLETKKSEPPMELTDVPNTRQ